MDIALSYDNSGCLICHVSDPEGEHTVTASDGAAAASSLLSALEDAEASGLGECFWPGAEGEYRWVIRRQGDQARVSVTWCASIAIGWQHVLWLEDDFGLLASGIRRQIERLLPAT